MKKLLMIILFLLMPVMAFADEGTVTYSESSIQDHNFVATFSFIANTGGTVPATASTDAITGWVCQIETNPGAVAPTTLYDITLTIPSGLDIAGGQLADRSATVTESIIPKVDAVGIYGCFYVDAQAVTANISGNSVNSATGEIKLKIWSDKESPL